MHPTDGASLGLADGGWAEVAERGGARSFFKVRVTDTVPAGATFIPFHWGARRHGGGPVNSLTDPTFDPVSKQPGLKYARVRVRPARGRRGGDWAAAGEIEAGTG